MPSFENKKSLRFVITLGTGKFGASDNNQITIEGFRSVAEINKAGGMMMGELRAKIYGVTQSDMNSITTLQWKPNFHIPNTVEVYAIDGGVETLVFAGNIVNAWGDYNAMPDVFLMIQAQAAYFNQLSTLKPTSFKGAIDVAIVMQQLALSMGYTFENNGVSVMLTDIYLANTGIEQMRELARMANISLYLDDKILAIAPRDGPRNTVIPRIANDSGLIGYPTFDGVGVNFQSLFNPAVVFGGQVELATAIKQAAGTWIVTSVAHRLEAEKPGGAWFSQIRGNANGLAVSGK